MKSFKILFLAMVVMLFAASSVMAGPVCTKIQSGSITDSAGNVIQTGFDQYGYNYQAHMFNGLYENYSRPAVLVTEGTVNLIMKWSDEWMSNVDCNQDGKLDRGLDSKTGISTGTSMGWLTNHEEGDYVGVDGESHHYTYFSKIVWVGPALSPDPFASVRIWGVYAIIEEVWNDPYAGYKGVIRDTLARPAGLGAWTN